MEIRQLLLIAMKILRKKKPWLMEKKYQGIRLTRVRLGKKNTWSRGRAVGNWWVGKIRKICALAQGGTLRGVAMGRKVRRSSMRIAQGRMGKIL